MCEIVPARLTLLARRAVVAQQPGGDGWPPSERCRQWPRRRIVIDDFDSGYTGQQTTYGTCKRYTLAPLWAKTPLWLALSGLPNLPTDPNVLFIFHKWARATESPTSTLGRPRAAVENAQSKAFIACRLPNQSACSLSSRFFALTGISTSEDGGPLLAVGHDHPSSSLENGLRSESVMTDRLPFIEVSASKFHCQE